MGWIQNTNDGPTPPPGRTARRPADFPRYMDDAGENVRGLHAIALLSSRHDFTLDGLRAAAFDPNLPGSRF